MSDDLAHAQSFVARVHAVQDSINERARVALQVEFDRTDARIEELIPPSIPVPPTGEDDPKPPIRWEFKGPGQPYEYDLIPGGYRERVLLDMARQLDEQADAYNRYMAEIVGTTSKTDATVAYGIRQAARYVRAQASDKA